MSLEIGGRSDKSGNQYENRFLAKLLIRLMEERLTSIEVEPLGDEGKGVEYIVETSTGERIFYQCKASNGAKNKWSIADLDRLKIFRNAKTHILADKHNEFHFISPLPYDGLDDLCERARTNHDPKDFIDYQLSNKLLRNLFTDCEKRMELSRDNSDELRELLYILAHCRFELIPNGYEATTDLESLVSKHFVGKAETARGLLENCANENRWYGIKITAQQVASYMEKQGFSTRMYGADERSVPRIQMLNTTYWGNYLPINGELVSREASLTVLSYIKEGKSVVLHGRAGSGKSGCAEEVIKMLANEQIPYLAIKLDKHVPEISADAYGRKLGLSESPVYCLKKVAANNPCVLILDQLDSLRWTAKHSAIALSVCKEMIVQAEAINRAGNGRVSILFITRTFDYKNDNGIKNLFSKDDSKSQAWKHVEVGLLSDAETAKIVGATYRRLSPRLQKLLHTPSNLYVWTQLHESKRINNIASVNQLMEKWWEQILERCEMSGLLHKDVVKTINSIATQMGSSTLFALPRRVFASESNIIDALISNGVLVENIEKISFVHQSFLDYFLATEAIQTILAGGNLVDIVGNKDEQTPNLRYRLLSILQGLSEVDDTLFLAECQKFLDSDSVRYYYKCAVFETLAQCDNPSVAVMEFAKKYLIQENWREYVRQVVYYGNLPFVKYLENQAPFAWMSDEGLWLLQSINTKDPDFVVKILLPYAFKTTEDNGKVYKTLCHDAFEDTESMYSLRMQLLESEPIILSDSWFSFYNSFENAPEKCVDYLKLLIQNHDNDQIKSVHLPDEKILRKYSQKNAVIIVSNIFPVLCCVTANLGVDIDRILYSDYYTKWSNEQYSHSCLRKIVQIVSWAMQELGENEPETVCKLIGESECYKSLVGNELILSALERMPLEYADAVIGWMAEEFPLHLFDYTSEPSNFLETGKRIIKRFSPCCSDELFYRLEQIVVSWKDDRNRILRIFRCRIEDSKERGWYPVYYSYWGHMQKELLPAFDSARLSVYAKELIAVVNRNTWIQDGHYHAHCFMGAAKSVVSPVDGYAEKLSDKTWLRIIRTPAEKMSHQHSRETKSAFVEATPFAFSSALESAAKKNPERFALLSLRFPEGCYPGYISAILRALREVSRASSFVKVELVSEVIRKFWQKENSQIRRDISDLLEKRAAEEWPRDVLEILQKIALMPQEPMRVGSKNGEISAHDLHTEAINTPRGCALNAMAAMLWEHNELSEVFEETIEAVRIDPDASVRFAAASCAVAYYNIDAPFSTKIFRQLLNQDLRIFVAPNAWEILCLDYRENAKFYAEKLIEACSSEMKDLSETAAGFACALAVFFSDAFLLNFIMNNRHTDDMVNRISIQAAATFGREEYREVSAQILLHMSTEYDVELSAFSSEFFKKNIVIQRDTTFLQQLLESRSGTKTVYSFLKYLSESDQDITCFADTIKVVGEQLPQKTDDHRDRMIVKDLIQCVIQLFDRGKNDPKIRGICLDVWDKLFRSNLHDIKPLADMLDNFD